MKVKQYNLFKAAKKTATENNLEIGENPISKVKTLLDFSFLEEISDLTDTEKNLIKRDAINNVCSYNKELLYGAEIDPFTSCIGWAVYVPHKVYSKDGKHLYNIMQLVKIFHTHSERKNVYAEWENVQPEYKSNYTEPMDDIEI